MDGNKHVTATFTTNSYPVVVNVVGPGSVTKSPDQPDYAYGTSLTLTAIPVPGAQFVAWSGSVSGSSNPITLTVHGAENVTATFQAAGLNYTMTRFKASYAPISAAGGAGTLMVAAHDSTRSIPLPFDFAYAGTIYPAGNFLAVSAN